MLKRNIELNGFYCIYFECVLSFLWWLVSAATAFHVTADTGKKFFSKYYRPLLKQTRSLVVICLIFSQTFGSRRRKVSSLILLKKLLIFSQFYFLIYNHFLPNNCWKIIFSSQLFSLFFICFLIFIFTDLQPFFGVDSMNYKQNDVHSRKVPLKLISILPTY